jgi:probable F420-dependent oxidoreductase
MDFGVIMFPTDLSIDPVSLARAVEERGFESLWFPEHTHIPTRRQSPWPGGPDLPEWYRRTLDQFSALSAAAAVTSRIRLGTGISLVVQHDPIDLAKQVATLDVISNGRAMFGVGGGWNTEEMANHGTDPSRRFALMAERIKAMQEIWTNDEAEFHGTFVDFDPIWQWPKPVQQPHPPILVGGGGSRVIDRVLDYGTTGGWMPIPGRGNFAGQYAELQRRAAEAGKDRIPVSIFGGPVDEAAVEQYRDTGADRYIFNLPSARADEVLPILDRCAVIQEKLG